jgi:hypothetical protein
MNYPSFSNFSPPAIQCTDEVANSMVSKLYKAFRKHQKQTLETSLLRNRHQFLLQEVNVKTQKEILMFDCKQHYFL